MSDEPKDPLPETQAAFPRPAWADQDAMDRELKATDVRLGGSGSGMETSGPVTVYGLPPLAVAPPAPVAAPSAIKPLLLGALLGLLVGAIAGGGLGFVLGLLIGRR